MSGALTYLIYQSWKNRLSSRFRRLRQPKYLMLALAGALYLIFAFGWQFLIPQSRANTSSGLDNPPENLVFLEGAWAMGLFVVVLLSWLIPHERAALIFSEAEVAFLFPAPVGRRTLIHFKLLKSQIRIFFTTLLFTFLFRRAGAGGPLLARAIGWWVILSTLNLHFLAASFARTILLERGISNWKRRIGVIAMVLAGAGAVIFWLTRTLPAADFENFTGLADLKYYFEQALEAGPLPYLLAPFRLVVKPYLTREPLAFLTALAPALVLLLLHYWWVVRSNVAFEEASVEASQKMAERVAHMRANRGQLGGKPKKKRRPPFKLRPTGMPAVALLWKNLIGAGQAFTLRFWLFCIWMGFIGGMVTMGSQRTFNLAIFAGMISLVFLALSFFVGPQLVRQDFRQDLPMADVLKTYPMRGWEVALGEILAPAAILTGIQWLLIVLCVGLTANLGKGAATLELRLSVASGLAIIAPFLNLVMLLIPNAAVLLFPGWFQTGRDAPQGVEATGQRMIFALGQMVVFGATLVPVALVFAMVYFLSQMVVGPYFSIPIASAASALIQATEVWLGLFWLGRLFDKFDVSAESGS